ncbi:amidase [Parasphingorhabdus sp.]|jgi:aspartyl-tRNA(Asn)/glutamyl-tRNA(Gln) amidotransferase subunit A|uniref:amidase n=1 Tax=Parasphingorhabdus sp. TaxID=2709688 RepID=UPI003002858F
MAGATEEVQSRGLASSIAGDELCWLPAWRIRELIAARDISPVEIVDRTLSRIEQLDPLIHAFRFVDVKGAKDQAAQAERDLVHGEALGPLFGIPISVKEHIAIKGMPYWSTNSLPHADTAGSPDWGRARRDSILVERLRKAGAIVIGTTIMPGFGTDPFLPELTNHPRNPWNLEHVPGGSTAGGAASVAAGITSITIGSDGAGSIREPAAMCGIVGFHPTPGRIPSVDYDTPSVVRGSTFGPLTRDVRDAALVMQILAGPDGRDPFEIQTPAPNYTLSLDDGVRGLRFAWTDDFGFGKRYSLPETPAVIDVVRKAAFAFRELGAAVDHTSMEWEDYFPSFVAMTAAYDTSTTIAYFNASQNPQSLEEAHEVYSRNWHRFQQVFSAHDLIISPTSTFTAPEVGEWDRLAKNPDLPHNHFMPTYGTNMQLFNILGWPAASIPCGFVNDMPVGMQIIGRPEQEALILRTARAYLATYPFSERPPPVARA